MKPAPSKPVTDFASAAMLRVLAQGMRELGLDPPPAPIDGPARGATVSLDEKRRLVAAALEQGGLGCLALLGRGLHRYAHEPTHQALASARDAGDLFTRWTRLERYIHSRHRIEVRDLSERRAEVVHRARPGLPPPLAAEDLVVLGVLVALLSASGAEAVTARIDGVPVYPEPDNGGLRALAVQHRTAAWCIGWTPVDGATRPPRPHPLHAPGAAAPQAWPEPVQRWFATLSADLMNPPTVSELARAHGEAPRSLQRKLGRAGLSYSQLLAQARCSAASRWLLETPTPIAEVGFLSGYADQPHFTRDFRSRVGMTPAAFRSAFGASD